MSLYETKNKSFELDLGYQELELEYSRLIDESGLHEIKLLFQL